MSLRVSRLYFLFWYLLLEWTIFLLAEPTIFPLIGSIRLSKVRSQVTTATISPMESSKNIFLTRAVVSSSNQPSAKPVSSPSSQPTPILATIFTSYSTFVSSKTRTVKATKVPTRTPSYQLPSIRSSEIPSTVPTYNRATTFSTNTSLFRTTTPTLSPSKKPFSRRPTKPSVTNVPTLVPTYPITESPIPSRINPTVISTVPPLVPQFPTTTPALSPSKKPFSRRPTKPSVTNVPTLVPTYPITESPTKAADIAYHNNGSVMTKTVNIYHIYFGRFDSAASQSMIGLMKYFASYIHTLPWFPVLTQYYQYQDYKKVYAAHNTTYKGSAGYKPGAVLLKIGINDIISSIVSSINSGKLPVDPNGVYFVIFRGDFEYDGWLTQWCGYHGSFQLTNNVYIKFAVLGDPSTTTDFLKRGIISTSCSAVSPPTANGNFAADSMITTYAHELAEVITDWDGNTWYADVLDSQTWTMLEVADLCNWNFGQSYSPGDVYNTAIGDKKVLVQQMFQRNVGCVMTI